MGKRLTVLSLFDGIAVAKVALDRAGIEYDRYYASEIDKYAIAVAKYNHPDIIHIGDIRYLKGKDFEGVDLIIGGSPCQNFSFAGKRQGMTTKTKVEITTLEQYLELKEEGYEFEGQSYLFWEYVRLLKEIKPKWFVLENVPMQRKWRDVISKTLGVEPIEINSALVSAQNRRRLYWTNIPVEGLPEDRGIVLADILEEDVAEKYYIKDKDVKLLNEVKGRLCKEVAKLEIGGIDQVKRVYSPEGKSPALTTMQGGYRQPKILVDRDKSLCLTASYCKGASLKEYLKQYRRQLVFRLDDNGHIAVRKLTPLECERLQTLPDNYTKYGVFNGEVKPLSDTQRYKLLGNAFTADVVAWILKYLK